MTHPPPRLPFALTVALAACATSSNRGAPMSSAYYPANEQTASATGSATAAREAPQQTAPYVPAESDASTAPLPQMSLPSTQGAVNGGYGLRPATQSPVRPGGVPAPVMAPTTPPPTAPMSPAQAPDDDALGRWESLLQRDSASLAAGLSECRDICAAASNICLAAREICRLTGDPSEAHCARARGACADAGHRRDSACAVCP